MKNGLVILVFLGVVLLAFFYMSPVTPSSEPTQTEETEHQHTDEVNTSDPDAQVEEALRQLQNRELPPMQAILKIREVAEKHPENVKANYTLGMLSMETAQFEKAAERFEKVLEQQPDDGQVWRLLAEAQMKSGDTTRAKQSFEKALQLVNESDRETFRKELPELNSIN